MTITLVEETGTGVANSNSYISRADADTYWGAQYYSSIWDALTNSGKDILLVMATRLLDEWVEWIGRKASSSQALRWPRYGTEDRDGYWFDSDVIPTFLKNATAELAGYLAKSDATSEPDTKGFSSMKIGDLALTIDKSDRDNTTTIPDSVLVMLEPHGNIRRRGGDGTAKLLRT